MSLFSSRFSGDLTPNRLTRALDAKHAAGRPILDLTESNPTRAGFDYSRTSLLSALASPAALRYDPSPRGLLSARQAVAGYYRRHGETVHPDSLTLTASTSEAYGYLFKLLADPGDEILIPRPGYPLLDMLLTLESLRPVFYPLQYDDHAGWQVDVERLRHSVGERSRAIVAVSPNNPTGSYLKPAELAALTDLCAERALALIVDEVFLDYPAPGGSATAHSAIANSGALTFVVSGLSKIAALPQVKLSWIHVGGPASLRAETQSRLDFIADTYLSVSTPVQHAAPALLAESVSVRAQIAARLERNEQTLRVRCAAGAGRVLRREGGWYAVLEIPPALSDDDLSFQLLEHDNVLAHPGYFYDFTRENVSVLSLLTPPDVFDAGLAKVLARIGMI
ncbi:MAG: pyridoxal phosphate-dependent aminotransferase [Chloroflexi bacterium]|nr:pyridoxal phosphate-dependent aminotransferase [Chloroflexota bacterium]